jgi:peptide/nickel transport system substrate-binding protein
LAIDRDAIVRLVYHGLAAPLWTPETEAAHAWLNAKIARPPRSVQHSRELLRSLGFSWDEKGGLLDAARHEVTFSLLVSSGNTQRNRIATLIQDDLKQIGITVFITSVEFRTMLDRVFQTHEYEAAVMSLDAGDTDPSSQINVLASKGNSRLWNLSPNSSTDWEREIDGLMAKQMITLDPVERRGYYDRVQELFALNLPFIPLVNPHVLVAAGGNIANLRPSVMRPQALWNADRLYFSRPRTSP